MLFYILLIYLIIINLLTYIIFALDKYKAIKKQRRIPEKTLLILSLIGWNLGALFAMLQFKHKTLKTSFKIKYLLILIIQLFLISSIIFIYIKHT